MPETAIPSSNVLNANLRAVLPVGIPLGWSLDALENRFTVRKAGSFYFLDKEGCQLWCGAWCGPDPDVLVNQLATEWKRPLEEVASDVTRFFHGGLLLQLVGDWRDDWLRLASLRVIPRTGIFDADHSKGYQMVLAGGLMELRLDIVYYSVWKFWDGINTVESAVAAAAKSSGLPRRLLQERAHSLLVAGIRTGGIFIDSTERAG